MPYRVKSRGQPAILGVAKDSNIVFAAIKALISGVNRKIGGVAAS